MDTYGLEDLKFYNSQVLTLGEWQQGMYLYDILSNIVFDPVFQVSLDDRVKQIKAHWNAEEICTTDIGHFILNMVEFLPFMKQYFERLDQNRSISNDTYSAVACKYCQSNKTKAVSIQIRGSDEPMTQFVWCMNPGCGKNYKQDD